MIRLTRKLLCNSDSTKSMKLSEVGVFLFGRDLRIWPIMITFFYVICHADLQAFEKLVYTYCFHSILKY